MQIKANGKDITKNVGNLTLGSNLDTLGDQLDFEVAYKTAKDWPVAAINAGDIIQIEDGAKEVFRGIVVSKTRNENTHSFSCFDYAFYLNKSKVIKQFNNVRADNAVKQLLVEFNVPMATIADMPVIINKIYYDKTVADVIADILDVATNTTGVKYVKEMNSGKFCIYKDVELVINCKVRLAENLPSIDISRTISNPTKTASIEEMRNSIKIYIGSDERVKVFAEAKNDAFISKYGLLQETQSIEAENIAQAKNIAHNLLKELGKVLVTGRVDVIGNFELRAGRIILLNEPITNLTGKYRIKSVTHNFANVHTASLDLEEI